MRKVENVQVMETTETTPLKKNKADKIHSAWSLRQEMTYNSGAKRHWKQGNAF